MIFQYVVSDVSKKTSKGIVEGQNENEAVRILKDKGFLVISVKRKVSFGDLYFRYLGRQKQKLSFNQLVDYTRQMGIMINAGLSLVDALGIIQKQNTNPAYAAVVGTLQDQIKNGNSFSHALEAFPDSFGNFYISLVKAGESSGKLDEVLLRLAEDLEKSREFRGKVFGSLIYPIVVIIAMGFVAFIMMTFVLPQLLDLYKNFKVELPLSTQIIIFLSTFLRAYWPLLIIVGIVGIGYFLYLMRQPKTKKIMDRLTLRLPVFGKIVQQSVLVEATRTLSVLLHSGVPLLEGLGIIKMTTSNLIYQESFKSVEKKVERGMSLGDALAQEAIFPDIFVQMTAVGEKTGQLDDTLMRLSRYFQMETELAIKTATTLIEPAILIVLGLGVGFLVVSIITPIYNLTSSFGS